MSVRSQNSNPCFYSEVKSISTTFDKKLIIHSTFFPSCKLLTCLPRDGAARIFLPPYAAAGIWTQIRELHLVQGPWKGRSTDWATATATTKVELGIFIVGIRSHRWPNYEQSNWARWSLIKMVPICIKTITLETILAAARVTRRTHITASFVKPDSKHHWQ